MTDDRTPADSATAHDRVDPAPEDGAEEIAGTGAAPVVPDPEIGGAEPAGTDTAGVDD